MCEGNSPFSKMLLGGVQAKNYWNRWPVPFTWSPVPTLAHGSVWTATLCCIVWIPSRQPCFSSSTRSGVTGCFVSPVLAKYRIKLSLDASVSWWASFNSQMKMWVEISSLRAVARAPWSLHKPLWVLTSSSVKQGQGHTPTVLMLQDFYKAQIESSSLLALTPIFQILPCSLSACTELTNPPKIEEPKALPPKNQCP